MGRVGFGFNDLSTDDETKFETTRPRFMSPCMPKLRQFNGAAVAVGAACHYTISSISIRRGGPGDTHPLVRDGFGGRGRSIDPAGQTWGKASACHVVGRRGGSPPLPSTWQTCRQRWRPAAHTAGRTHPTPSPGRLALASEFDARQFNLVMATAVLQQGPCGF